MEIPPGVNKPTTKKVSATRKNTPHTAVVPKAILSVKKAKKVGVLGVEQEKAGGG